MDFNENNVDKDTYQWRWNCSLVVIRKIMWWECNNGRTNRRRSIHDLGTKLRVYEKTKGQRQQYLHCWVFSCLCFFRAQNISRYEKFTSRSRAQASQQIAASIAWIVSGDSVVVGVKMPGENTKGGENKTWEINGVVLAMKNEAICIHKTSFAPWECWAVLFHSSTWKLSKLYLTMISLPVS